MHSSSLTFDFIFISRKDYVKFLICVERIRRLARKLLIIMFINIQHAFMKIFRKLEIEVSL